MKADLGVGRLVKLTKGIDLSRPRHEIVIIVIGLLADKILFSPWERFLHRRWGTGRA